MKFNAGELPFGRILTDAERKEVLECFGEKRSTRNILFSENKATKATVLVFDEYCGDISADLNELANWCKNKGIQIEHEASVSVNSDEDGSYVYSAVIQEFDYFSAEETAIRKADTEELVGELDRRISEPFIEIKVDGCYHRLPINYAEAAYEAITHLRLREHVFELLADNQEISLATLTDEEKNAIADKIIQERDLYVYDPAVVSEEEIWGMAIWDILHQGDETEVQ